MYKNKHKTIYYFVTVTLYLTVFLPLLTVMVAVPVFFAVIFPFLSTVAILLLEDFHLAMESPFVSVAFTAVVLFPFCKGSGRSIQRNYFTGNVCKGYWFYRCGNSCISGRKQE